MCSKMSRMSWLVDCAVKQKLNSRHMPLHEDRYQLDPLRDSAVGTASIIWVDSHQPKAQRVCNVTVLCVDQMGSAREHTVVKNVVQTSVSIVIMSVSIVIMRINHFIFVLLFQFNLYLSA